MDRPTVVAFRLRLAAPAVFWSWNGLAAACMAPLAEAWARAFCVAEGSTRRLDGGDPTSVALHTRAARRQSQAREHCHLAMPWSLQCSAARAHRAGRCSLTTGANRARLRVSVIFLRLTTDLWYARARGRHIHSATLATPHTTPTLVGQGFDRRIDGYFLMQHRRRGFGTARSRYYIS